VTLAPRLAIALTNRGARVLTDWSETGSPRCTSWASPGRPSACVIDNSNETPDAAARRIHQPRLDLPAA